MRAAARACLDIYKRTIDDLIQTISDVDDTQLSRIIDPDTTDPDCHSIQTILTHVVQSGYTYVVEIRKWLGETIDYREKNPLQSAEEYAAALNTMFEFTETLFAENPNISFFESNDEQKIKTRWGQTYDIEQLMEHAIVHIMRHERQIKRFKLKLGL